MNRADAMELRRLIERAADKGLSDEEALEGTVLFPAWEPDGQYTAGQRVREDGILYRCLQDHQAQAGWNPVDAPSLWARVLIEDPDTAPAWMQPDSTNAYAKGDRVTHKEHLWESEADGNVWEPGVYGWKLIE